MQAQEEKTAAKPKDAGAEEGPRRHFISNMIEKDLANKLHNSVPPPHPLSKLASEINFETFRTTSYFVGGSGRLLGPS